MKFFPLAVRQVHLFYSHHRPSSRPDRDRDPQPATHDPAARPADLRTCDLRPATVKKCSKIFCYQFTAITEEEVNPIIWASLSTFAANSSAVNLTNAAKNVGLRLKDRHFS